MTPDFWHQRWQRGETGWHSDDINPHLERHWACLGTGPGATVFVPLCGKSRDLLWLAGAGCRVIGNEISPLAVTAFFAENGLRPQRSECPPFTRFAAEEIELLLGDFFDLTALHLPGIDAVYDRASLVALPPAMRPRYAAALADLLSPGVPVLLITYDYDQAQMAGPPFAVSAAEVQALFSGAFAVEAVAAMDVLAGHPGLRARGLTSLTEHVYRLRRLG